MVNPASGDSVNHPLTHLDGVDDSHLRCGENYKNNKDRKEKINYVALGIFIFGAVLYVAAAGVLWKANKPIVGLSMLGGVGVIYFVGAIVYTKSKEIPSIEDDNEEAEKRANDKKQEKIEKKQEENAQNNQKKEYDKKLKRAS